MSTKTKAKLPLPQESQTETKPKRFVKVGENFYQVDNIPPLYGEQLNNVVTSVELPEPDEDGTTHTFGITTLSDLSNALESISEYIIPDLIDDGFVSITKRGKYAFLKDKEICLLMLLQLITIWLLDYTHEADYEPASWPQILKLRNGLLLGMKAAGLEEYFPDEVIDTEATVDTSEEHSAIPATVAGEQATDKPEGFANPKAQSESRKRQSTKAKTQAKAAAAPSEAGAAT